MRKYFLRVAWNLRDNSENIEVTPSLLAKSLLFYVQAIGYFHTKPEYYTGTSFLTQLQGISLLRDSSAEIVGIAVGAFPGVFMSKLL